MYTLDANIFVRDLDTREPQHAECHALLDEIQAQALPIFVPTLVLAEVAGTVSRTRRDPMAGRLAADLLRGIGNLTLISMDDSLAQEAAELAADYALRGADATYVAVARRHNCTLVSLDREQRERAAAIVTTRTPAEALADLQPPPPASGMAVRRYYPFAGLRSGKAMQAVNHSIASNQLGPASAEHF